MAVVEKAKEFWYTYIPSWLPVCGCILAGCWWVASTVTGMQRDIQSLQQQVQQIEQYLRTHHAKSDGDDYIPGVSSLQQPQTDASRF
jgi:hypothetical protein